MQPGELMNNISECPQSLASWYCLNGARCFSVEIQDSVLYNCWCAKGFHGARCDFKYSLHRQPLASESQDTRPPPTRATTIKWPFSGEVNAGTNHDLEHLSALHFVVAPERHEEGFLASPAASWLKRQQFESGRQAFLDKTYFILLYGSLVLSIILFIWLMIRFLSSEITETLPSDHQIRDGSAKIDEPLEARQSARVHRINQYELVMAKPQVSTRQIFERNQVHRQQGASAASYATRERSIWTNYDEANQR